MKAILFDACDILYHRPDYDRRMDEFPGPHWCDVQREHKDEFKTIQQRAALGRYSVDEMFDKMLSLYGVPQEQFAKGREAMAAIMDDVVFFDGVVETLHQLKSDGFKLAIITNSFQPISTKLKWFARVGIDNIWDAFVSSSETGLIKPQAEIYLKAIDLLSCKPHETAYVAHTARELDGAKAAGMISIGFNRDDDSIEADFIIEQFADLLPLARSLRQQAQC